MRGDEESKEGDPLAEHYHPSTVTEALSIGHSGRVQRGAANNGSKARSHSEVVLLHQLVLAQLTRALALELDLAVDDDVAAVGDLGRLVEVLLGHQHRELALLLQLLDLRDHAADEDGGQAYRRLVDEEE